MEDHPGDPQTIHVFGTVHHGRLFANPHAEKPPIWPK
jgi:hypothetical protein